ncbi:MAG: hypothetical protein M0D57_04025 [Sphingobacteriales bacterium JAD_PAG50586_3]|nr:MAG: hypothetical protein M0D57_04025 [Sphingobacteriales bacterium JAD_PAG50586_3]
MKKFALLLIAMVGIATGVNAQSWKELSAFHHLMSNTFHPAENGDYKPLRDKADSLYMAAVTLQKSAIPADYKEKETKETLDKLVVDTKAIVDALKKATTSEPTLFSLINTAHDTFHKVVGECKKDSHDGHGHGSHDGHNH